MGQSGLINLFTLSGELFRVHAMMFVGRLWNTLTHKECICRLDVVFIARNLLTRHRTLSYVHNPVAK